MNRMAWLVTGILATVAVAAIGVYAVRQVLYPHELERNPPKLDGLKHAVMDELHLEANVSTDAELGSEDQAERVTVTFVFVPPVLDKSEAERKVRELVKAYLPKAHTVDVRFGDNMRTRPIDIEQRVPGGAELPKGIQTRSPH